MPGAPVIATNSATTTSNPCLTGSVTWTIGNVYILFTRATHASSAFTDTTSVSGMSLTWTKVNSVLNGSSLILTEAWVGYGASGTTGQISITRSQSPARSIWHVLELKCGVSDQNPVDTSYTGSGTGTTGTITYTTSAAGKMQISLMAHQTNEAQTVDSTYMPWTSLLDTGTTNNRLQTAHNLVGTDPVNTATWATSSDWEGIGLLIKKSSLMSHNTGPDDWVRVEGIAARLSVAAGGDDEGSTVPGKPSGMWSILGGGVS